MAGHPRTKKQATFGTTGFFGIFKSDIRKNILVYLMLLPVLLYFVVFHYVPMYGAVIAFKDFTPSRGILYSPWAGLRHFRNFFNSYYFTRIVRNTISINLWSLLVGFPAPIIFALMLHELQSWKVKRATQTLSYLPHFISIIVISGIIIDFVSSNGLITNILSYFGFEKTNLLMKPNLFQPIYIISGIWQNMGWGSIIYMAALTGISPELYMAASIDGAGRWRKLAHITLPGIMPTIVILLILRIGRIMSIGFEKIILLYNPVVYEKADVISSFVYRKGLLEFDYSYTAAVGLFNSVINFCLLLLANWLSRRVNETSLW